MSAIIVSPFSQQCNQLINTQINKELTASYVYQALGVYFSRHDIALGNVAQFFKKASDEEREHADKFINYSQLRGGNVVLNDIKAPKLPPKIALIDAFIMALNLEKEVFQSIMSLYHAAEKESEAHFASFLEEDFLSEQIHEEDKYVRIITVIKRMGTGLGEQLFDKDIIAHYE